VVFARTPFFHKEPTATRVAIAGAGGALQSGMLVETWSQVGNLLHETLVGPSGEVVFSELRTNNDSYNVFAIDPSQSIQTVVGGGTGWLSTDAQSTVNIRGANVRAYLDTNADNVADAGGATVADGNFLTALNGAAAASTTGNKAVAVQNLFYLNNVMHDTLKAHGFNTTAGNFEGADPVNAEAQDGSGTDNANFSTPPDGSSPRMQMYLWSNPTPNLEVLVNSVSYIGKNAEFGLQLTRTGINGPLALASVADGCSKLKSLAGRVALIDRGTCSFKKKVANAQAAGAIGVVIGNTEDDGVFVMGDDPAVHTAITIGSVFVGRSAGSTLKALAQSSPAAQLRDRGLPLLMADASLDSDVVFHEYGHGLTWRMIGGMSGPIAGAIGEGASDGVALLVNAGDVVGEYSAGNRTGIRRYPYRAYPLTYGAVNGAEVHDDGEVFAAIVYRLKENFQAAGVAVSELFDYYVDGMNFTPSTPAFEDMRDGMLQSAANASLGHDCLIWKSFADFGVGVGARAIVSRRGTVTITESRALPLSCQ
jgi:extracellular elastinolytic metalloproteinase